MCCWVVGAGFICVVDELVGSFQRMEGCEGGLEETVGVEWRGEEEN